MAVLDKISHPSDVKHLSSEELSLLAEELRAQIIAATSLNGGHLASSLGAVELILACYRVLDLPHDKLVFDVGHQSYAHKMLTGRLDGFADLRQLGGVSGFTRRSESIYDVHDSGHASDSLAIALGLAAARDIDGGHEQIVAIIGDASIGGGLSFEALNMIGQRKKGGLVVILNDNEMSISRTTGAVSAYLASIRTSQTYRATRDTVEGKLSKTGIGAGLVRLGEKAKASTKQFLVPGMLFEEFGFVYLGPIDGHDINVVQATLKRALEMGGPVIIHAVTRKGEGYGPAEQNPELFHGVGPFDPKTGVPYKDAGGPITFTKAFSQSMLREAQADERIVAITAAMSTGTGLDDFAKRFPTRFFDVGIAEECAVTMAAGMAIAGKVPVVAIYSTFLQRAYDEVVTNVCLPNLHVVFAIDRAGLVGQDGSTHHGALDLAYLRSIPNMRLIAPSNEDELARTLHCALAMDGPVAIRYPRGKGLGVEIRPEAPFAMGATWEREGKDVALLAIGDMVATAREVAHELDAQGVSCGVADMRWAKPIDGDAVRKAAQARLVVTLEDGVVRGGFGSAVLEEMAAMGLHADVLCLGLPDGFVGHGDTGILLRQVGLDPAHVCSSICERLRAHADSCSGR